MLKLRRVIKVKVLFLVLVYVFNFHLFEFSATILEKDLCRGELKDDKMFVTVCELTYSFYDLLRKRLKLFQSGWRFVSVFTV